MVRWRDSSRSLLLTLAVSALLFALGVAAVRVGSPARVAVTWETASEVETAGFHVLRARSPDGDFTRITETPVPAEGDPLVGASYRYEDIDVTWGQRYVYQLEEVELDGTRNRYDETVQGRAGLGWPWALAAGAALAALGALVARMLLQNTPAEDSPQARVD
jgi:hypothetical protein